MKNPFPADLKATASLVVLMAVVFIVGMSIQPACVKANPDESQIVVLSSSGFIRGLTPQAGHLILMDQRAGEIWAYSDMCIASGTKPIFIGKFEAVGQPIIGQVSESRKP